MAGEAEWPSVSFMAFAFESANISEFYVFGIAFVFRFELLLCPLLSTIHSSGIWKRIPVILFLHGVHFLMARYIINFPVVLQLPRMSEQRLAGSIDVSNCCEIMADRFRSILLAHALMLTDERQTIVHSKN